jgi:polysaccharide pyruvyl transferase WcaK-like protein
MLFFNDRKNKAPAQEQIRAIGDATPKDKKAGLDLLVSGASGNPNIGDDSIALAVADYHAKAGRDVWLNSLSPSVAFGCSTLSPLADKPKGFVDYLWQVPHDRIKNVRDAIQEGLSIFERAECGKLKSFIDLLASAKLVHFHGGGYLNSWWPHSAFQIGAGLAMKRKFGTRLVATGLGLMPMNPDDRAALAEASLEFSFFECRDEQSANAILKNGGRALAGVDDLFIAPQSEPKPEMGRPDLHINLQTSEWTEQDGNDCLDKVATFIRQNQKAIARIIVWEFLPVTDLKLLSHPLFVEFKERLEVRTFSDIMSGGIACRVNDLAIVSRFHAHLLFCQMGARGLFCVKGGPHFEEQFYDVKHASLLHAGSNWKRFESFKRIEMKSFPSSTPWVSFRQENHLKKSKVFGAAFSSL